MDIFYTVGSIHNFCRNLINLFKTLWLKFKYSYYFVWETSDQSFYGVVKPTCSSTLTNCKSFYLYYCMTIINNPSAEQVLLLPVLWQYLTNNNCISDYRIVNAGLLHSMGCYYCNGTFTSVRYLSTLLAAWHTGGYCQQTMSMGTFSQVEIIKHHKFSHNPFCCIWFSLKIKLRNLTQVITIITVSCSHWLYWTQNTKNRLVVLQPTAHRAM